MIRCVIFDFGDTLSQTSKTNKQTLPAYLRGLVKVFKNKYSLQDIIKAKAEAEKRCSKIPREKSQTKRNQYIFERIFLESLGEKPTTKMAKMIATTYYDLKLRKTILFKETKPILKYLKEKGIIICVITNTVTNTNLKLSKKHGIYKYFSCFLMSHEQGTIKSELEIFNRVLTRINKKCKNQILASECLMVGNDLQEDTSAKKAGMKTAILKKTIRNSAPERAIEPDFYLSNLLDIKKIVEDTNRNCV